MTSTLMLDARTLIITGNALLVLMLVILSSVRSELDCACPNTRLWMLSIALVLATGAGAMQFADQTSNASSTIPMPVAVIMALMGVASTLQLFSLRGTSGKRVTLSTTALTASCVGGAALLLATTLPAQYGGRVLPAIHVAIPLLALPVLISLTRGGIGGWVISVSQSIGFIANAFACFGLLHMGGRDPTVLILSDLLALFGSSLGLLLWHQEHTHRMLVQAAVTDALTGALNRHGLMPMLERELELKNRSGRALSVVLCDLDHFKQVNDRYGHAVGDAVLKAFVARAVKMLRQGDLVGRWGGEEFLLVLPDTEKSDAIIAVERLRRPIGPSLAGEPLVTFSAGIATTSGSSDRAALTQLLDEADRLLYRAKETRDCIAY